MTKIVSNLEDDGSFSMKSIEMEFHGHSEMGDGELFEGSVGLVTLWLGSYTSDIGLAELLYISMETGPGVSVAD